jgi:hypothetical protein
MLTVLVATWLLVAPAAGQDPEADLIAAGELFQEGVARYDAADFNGSIEVWMRALGKVASVEDFQVRGLLLFNIGRAHVRAYDIDRDVTHLRQAKTILTRFVEEARSEAYAGQIDDETIAEAEQQLAEVARLLGEDEDEPAVVGPTDEPTDEPNNDRTKPVDDPKPAPSPTKLRNTGIALLVPGVALVGAGVGMLAWGAGFGAAAQSQVDGFDLSPDDPDFDRGEDYVAGERSKGTSWMIAGGVGMTIGVVGVALGARQLIRAKKARANAVSVAPNWFGGYGLVVSGRF